MSLVVAIDAGTTGVRCIAFDSAGVPISLAYRELTQYFPQPGWVEHDAAEIWTLVEQCIVELTQTNLPSLGYARSDIAAVGITNQRETVVAWNKSTGKPLCRAIVWQDRRTAGLCEYLTAEGLLPTIRSKTGLVLDPYFSATKIHWMLTSGEVRPSASLALGTVDDWLIWNLTGGADGGVHATECSNASRTLLFDIAKHQWSQELCDSFSVPIQSLGEVRPSSGHFGTIAQSVAAGALSGVCVSGVLGDQQAALLGQGCTTEGMSKNTYGTGSFVLINAGSTCPEPCDGLLTTAAWDIAGQFVYALEGTVFIAGAAINWLRDGIGIIASYDEIDRLSGTVESSEGVYFVPAFTGLGSPYWDPYARGSIVGITRGTNRAHIVRATLESLAYGVRDVLETMARAGVKPKELRVDGGSAINNWLLQFQANQLQLPVRRPVVTEATAAGAALAAGIGAGLWASTAEAQSVWTLDREFLPDTSSAARMVASEQYDYWLRAIDRSRNWVPVT